jgi:hypothetical protein
MRPDLGRTREEEGVLANRHQPKYMFLSYFSDSNVVIVASVK